jgi:hypothetical protein
MEEVEEFDEKEIYSDQYETTRKVLVEGVKKVRSGLLDIVSAVNGIHCFPVEETINLSCLEDIDLLILAIGVKALFILHTAVKKVGVFDELSPAEQKKILKESIEEILEAPSLLNQTR